MVHVALSLFLSCCRSVSLIDSACRQANEKLHRLAAVLPDAASLPPLEYDTSRRADPEVLQRLVAQAKTLRVREDGVARDTQCFIPFPACLPHLSSLPLLPPLSSLLSPQQEVQVLHQRVAARTSELESKVISGEATQSTVCSAPLETPLPTYLLPTSPSAPHPLPTPMPRNATP